MEKSHVSMEQRKCKVCTKDYESGAVLLDIELRKRFEYHTLTGWVICPACKEQIDNGFIALVIIDISKSTVTNGLIKPEDAWRTGEIMFMKKEASQKIFNPPPDDELTFIDQEASIKLKSLIP